MFVATARLDLALDGSRSLKDKRQIVRSIIERTRARFRVAVSEVEDQDLWQRAVLGVAYVSSTSQHANEVMQKVVQFVIDAHPECEVLDQQIEILAPF